MDAHHKSEIEHEAQGQDLPTSQCEEGAPAQEPGAVAAKPLEQAERAAMHPERNDLEWRYCHGAWHA